MIYTLFRSGLAITRELMALLGFCIILSAVTFTALSLTSCTLSVNMTNSGTHSRTDSVVDRTKDIGVSPAVSAAVAPGATSGSVSSSAMGKTIATPAKRTP